MIVEDVFRIAARDELIVVPGPLLTDGSARVNGPVSMKRPDGSTVTAILRMESIFQSPPSEERRWACLLRGVHKSDVPIGTEIWPAD